MIKYLLLGAVAATGLVFVGPAAVAPAIAHAPQSFDCNKASGRAEKLICADSDLGIADKELGDTYKQLLAHSPAGEQAKIRAGQRAWLTRRDGCADGKCLTALYEARQSWLWSEIARQGEFRRRNVSRVGQCEVTTIEEIGPRLEGGDRPNESGTSVSFANGVSQVSYELERPVAQSRTGDRVRVCLVSIPRNCPKGDDRGREYAVTNLRTGGKWRMPDSQHMCGGA